ncbi:MAG: hypothetical protein WAS73_13765 [Defluviicoccus sp.]
MIGGANNATVLIPLKDTTAALLETLRARPNESLADVVARLALRPPTAPAAPMPNLATAGKRAAEVLGERVVARTYGQLFANVVDLMAALDPSVLERLARTQGRLGFSCVSRSRRNFRRCDKVIKTSSGWWVSGIAGEDHVWRWLRDLCEAGSLKYGEDVRFPVK